MYNKETIIEDIKSLNLKYPHELLMGGSLVLHDMRDTTNDIDLSIHPDDFKAISSKYNLKPVLTSLGNYNIIFYGNHGTIELFEVKDIEEHHTDIIDGIHCQTLKNILSMKKYFNREKDQKDIILIESYLNQDNIK